MSYPFMLVYASLVHVRYGPRIRSLYIICICAC
jgi:hypothetical protein